MIIAVEFGGAIYEAYDCVDGSRYKFIQKDKKDAFETNKASEKRSWSDQLTHMYLNCIGFKANWACLTRLFVFRCAGWLELFQPACTPKQNLF